MFRDGPLNPPFSDLLREKFTMGPLHLPSQPPRVPTSLQRIRVTGKAAETVNQISFNFQFFFIGKPDKSFFRVPLC